MDFDTRSLCGWSENHPDRLDFAARAPKLAQMAPHLYQAVDPNASILLYKAWKEVLGDYPKYVAQVIGDCFVEGTKVLMSDGSEKNIEDIQVGEQVMSHLNRPRIVTNTIKKPYSGDMVGITAKGFAREVVATKDHRFAHFAKIGKKIRKSDSREFQWTPADLLEENCRVLIPWGQADEPSEYPVIDVMELVEGAIPVGEDKFRVKFSNRTCNRFVLVDAAFSWLMGLYLAEGGVDDGPTGNPCRITLNLNSMEFYEAVHAVEAFAEVFGVEAKTERVPSKPNVLYVRCSNAAVARVFKALVPEKIYKKSIPQVIFETKRVARTACLRGWIDGDGCYSTGTSFKVNGISSSHNLANDMCRLALTLKIRPKLHQRKQAEHQRVAAKSIDFYADSAVAIYPEIGTKIQKTVTLTESRSDVTEHGLALRINEPRRFQVENIDVYCIEVDQDHGFIANGYGVHNCTSFGSGHTVDLSQCIDIAVGHKKEDFKEICTEAIYGAGRDIAGMLHSWGDGCYGGAVAQACRDVGCAPREAIGSYSGQRAKQWGSQGIPQNVKDICSQHKIKSFALVQTCNDVDAALANGYVGIVCSNQGFTMNRDQDGVCRPSGHWSHCMSWSGRRVKGGRRQYCIDQSWGPNTPSGPTSDDQPDFSFWIDEAVFASMLSGQDSYAFSNFDGFPGKGLPGSWTPEDLAP